MGVMWGRSSSLEWDDSGELAEGALAYFFEAGTSTPKAVYSDGGESTAHEHPVEADSARWPGVFIPFGSYKLVIKTAGGTTLFEEDNIPNPEPFDETFELDEDTILNTGDIFISLKNGTRSGAVRLNGRTIGDASSSATERANADTSDLFAFLWNNLANGQAAVSGGRGASAAADYAAHKTIALPDWRGCSIAGLDDMGNSAASRLGSAPVVSGSTILAGSILGENTHVLTSGELAAHTHGVTGNTGAEAAHTHAVSGNTAAEAAHTHTGTTGVDSPDHSHNYNTAVTKVGNATGFAGVGGVIWCGADAAAASGGASTQHTHGFTTGAGSSHLHSISFTSAAGSSHLHAVSLTSASAGSDTAHNILSRSGLVTFYIKL